MCCMQTTLARAAAAACGAHVIAINGPELLSRYVLCSTVDGERVTSAVYIDMVLHC
jgi:SpoVK/Ycf46/Vps4 family AAA+-type ATPase